MRRASRLLAAFVILLALALALPAGAFADQDGAGNVISGAGGNSIEALSQRDYIWFGSSVGIRKMTVSNDALMAGAQIAVQQGRVGGSFRAAAESLSLENLAVCSNLTVASGNVVVGQGCAVEGACYIAADEVSFSGSATTLQIIATKVVIGGRVNGSVRIEADEVVFASSANCSGKVQVKSSKAPIVQDGASVPKLSYEISKTGNGEGALAAALSVALVLVFVMLLGSLVSTLVLSLVLNLVIPARLAAAARLYAVKPGSTVGAGLVAGIMIPVAVAALALLVVTLPLAGVLAVAALLASLVATSFAGAVAGRLMFPKMNRWASGVLATLGLWIVEQIPLIGIIAGAAAGVFLLGYLVKAPPAKTAEQ